MKYRFRLELALALTALIAAGAALAIDDRIVAAAFSAMRPGNALPAGWAPADVPNIKVRTRCTLVDDDGITVIRADSASGAAGLSRTLRIDPVEFPWLRWRWKINNTIEKADLRTRAGDDFPARLYVMFDYPLDKLPLAERTRLRLARALFDPHLPAATLCYVWDGKAAVETIVSSAYTDRVKLIVVESGATRLRQWVDMERNIASDFRAAFGEDPPPVSGVAIATDTDNTGAVAISFFGDILFNKQRVIKKSPAAQSPP